MAEETVQAATRSGRASVLSVWVSALGLLYLLGLLFPLLLGPDSLAVRVQASSAYRELRDEALKAAGDPGDTREVSSSLALNPLVCARVVATVVHGRSSTDFTLKTVVPYVQYERLLLALAVWTAAVFYLFSRGPADTQGDGAAVAQSAGRAAAILAVGVGLLWVCREALGIRESAVLLGVLVAPAVVYAAVSGQLSNFSLFGASVEFAKRVEQLDQNVTEIGEYGPERSTYLGKLRQVWKKDGRQFSLLYADVDGLRKISRDLYLTESEASGNAPDAQPRVRTPTRRSEKEIQREIIGQLAFALSDAFYEVKAEDEKAKYDLFFLEEPDIAMIARRVTPSQARAVGETALGLFSQRTGQHATVAILMGSEIAREDPNARDLDRMAAGRLRNWKDVPEGRGKVHDRD